MTTTQPLPRLEIYPERIAENTQAIGKFVHDHGGKMWGVGKVLCAHPSAVAAMVEAGADGYADSRIENLEQVRGAHPDLRLLLLRLVSPSQAERVVATADLSLNSSLTTMTALSDAAKAAGRPHQVIVMVDVGDLREGVWPDKAVELVCAAAKLPGIEVAGVGTNLACFGGVEPSVENMRTLVEVRDACASASGCALEHISGGNSSALPLLASGKMPAEINNFRMGESIVLGRNVLNRDPWPGTRQDTVKVVTEVIEVERKPSVPPSASSGAQNAFGEVVEWVDRGERMRAICALGRQDAVVDGLTPVDSRAEILGASSDHMIVDVEDLPGLKVGDTVEFWPNYGSLLALSTSAYVSKVEAH